MNATIRRGGSSDLAQIQRLDRAHYAYSASRRLHPDALFDDNWPYSEAGTKFFQEHLADTPNKVTFLVESDGSTVGYIIGGYKVSAYRVANPLAEIEIMFLEESYRNQGVGAQLMNAFIDWARSHQCAQIRVGTFVRNHEAHKFYKKFGFADLEVYLERALS